MAAKYERVIKEILKYLGRENEGKCSSFVQAPLEAHI